MLYSLRACLCVCVCVGGGEEGISKVCMVCDWNGMVAGMDGMAWR